MVQELLQRLALILLKRAKRSKRSKGRASPFSRMIRAAQYQSVRSPTIRWPTMSNALQVAFLRYRILRRRILRCGEPRFGQPAKQCIEGCGVRVRTAMEVGQVELRQGYHAYLDAAQRFDSMTSQLVLQNFLYGRSTRLS